jgi:hypothetical protein
VYFVGLHYLYSMTSATVIGVGRDAERIANAIESKIGMTKACVKMEMTLNTAR